MQKIQNQLISLPPAFFIWIFQYPNSILVAVTIKQLGVRKPGDLVQEKACVALQMLLNFNADHYGKWRMIWSVVQQHLEDHRLPIFHANR